jgi:hypothetical protein
MNTKTKSGKKAGSRRKTASTRNVRAKMQLLGFVRGKDEFLSLITGMQSVDQELAASYEHLRTCEPGTVQEDDCLWRIRQLEDRRFQLLSELHGNRVKDYHLSSGL